MQAEVVYLLYGLNLLPYIFCRIDEYHFINIQMTWKDAQQFCRQNYTDLATIESLDNIYRISIPDNVWAWIGLTDDPVSWRRVMNSDPNSWRWSATGSISPSQYQNWGSGDPNDASAVELCVFIQNGYWKDYNCASELWFACYTVQSNTKQFFVITTLLNWVNARTYCRQHYLDLAMIETSSENQALTAVLPTTTAWVWVGLSRVSWRWSDGSNSSFRRWLSGEPNNAYGSEYCASQRYDYVWNDASCSSMYPFICHKVLKRSSAKTQMRFSTSADLSDPGLNDQLLTQIEKGLGVGFTLSWNTPPKKEETKLTNDDQEVCIF